MIMTAANAWRIVAERAQSTVTSDDEQIVLCDALGVLASRLLLQAERATTEKLRVALRQRAEAQMEFCELLSPVQPSN